MVTVIQRLVYSLHEVDQSRDACPHLHQPEAYCWGHASHKGILRVGFCHHSYLRRLVQPNVAVGSLLMVPWEPWVRVSVELEDLTFEDEGCQCFLGPSDIPLETLEGEIEG